MPRGLVKTAVLSAVFVLAVIIFGRLTNHVNEDMTMEMEEATLPVISLYQNEMEINELHGYQVEMNAAYMRDTITPIGEDRLLPVSIQTYQTAVDHISYEIRSLDASRLIANAEVDSYEDRKGIITAELEIQNLLETGEEYLLIIKLESGAQAIYYYTRIMELRDSNVEDCIEFALDFNNKTFNSETVGSLSSYMEKTTGDNSSLHYVSLNSSLKQLGWSDFKVERLTAPVPSVKEITGTYNVIMLNYVVTSLGEGGESEYYNVEEYYRIRYTSNRFYLLNFDRTVNQIFRGENSGIAGQYVQLGIRSEEVEYKSNEAGTTVAFVQEGELWGYHTAENTLAKVFSFRGYEEIDSRENYGEHDIKIVGVNEAGSMDYIVYGYMNRGIHEGQVGIAVYHYDSLSNTNEELVFIPSDKSYEVMKSELGQLMYLNEGGELFLMLDGNIYGIDLGALKTHELVKGLKDELFAASVSNRLVAWVDSERLNENDSIHVMNLSDLQTIDITAGSGEALKPLGFMGENFVYGIARKDEIFQDAAGNITFPMYQLRIVDISGKEPELLKTYEKAGYYVSGVTIDDYTMYLNRIQYNGTAYVEADGDIIRDKEGDAGKLITIHTVSTDEKKAQIQIVLGSELEDRTPKLLTPKETILEEERTVSIQEERTSDRYYVYVKGNVTDTTDNVTEAVIAANEKMGVVVGDDQRYVWKRSRKASVAAFSDIAVGAEDATASSIAQCINAMLEKEGINISVGALIAEGETPKNILSNTMKDMRVIDLTGCNTEETLYYVSCGSPVFAMTGGNDAALLVGYDSTNVFIFNPASSGISKMPVVEADEMFANAGSVFFTYLSK